MKKTPTKTLFFVIPLLFVFELGAQNLVTNPSFEIYSSCPFALAQLNLATGWYNPTVTSPDFYHVCGTYPASIPVNLPGTQDPLTGQGYAGIVVHHGSPIPDYREYIQTVLSEPLIAGFCYDIEMFTSAAEFWPMNGISHVGMYLSVSPPSISGNGQINVIPQLYYNNVVLDINNWVPLTGTYVATGGEQYLTIGNFEENGNYDIQPLDPPGGGTDAAYYYIEDVKVELAQGGQQDVEATICEGECYEYEGQDYCAEGTYEIFVQGGCFNLVNLTVYVDELAIADIELPEILDCNITQTTLDASGSSSGPGVSYQWTGPNNFSSNQQNPSVFDPGTYILTVSGTGLCSTEASIEVLEDIVYPDIVAEVSGVLDCNNLVVTLTGSSNTQNVTYQWNGPGVDVNTQTALAIQSGIYTLVITGPGGCTSTEDIMVEEDLEQPDIFAEVLGVLDCNTPSVVLLGSSSTPNATYIWSGPGVNSNDLTALAEFPGDYSFVVIGPNGCISTQIVTVVEVITILDINASVSGMLDCENTTVTLTGTSNSPNITYQWVGPGVFDDAPIVEAEQPGEYIFSIVDNFGCTAQTSVIVVQNTETPVIAINTPDTINCSTPSVDLDASGSSGNGGLNFEWQNENGDILGNGAVLNVTASGIYILILTDNENGCSGQSGVEVFGDTNQPEAIVDSNGNLNCNIGTVTLDGGNSSGNALEFQWLNSGGDVISMDTTVDVSVAGVYSLLITNTASGCTSSASIEVESNIDLPTVIIANPDTLSCFINDAILDGNGSSEGLNFFYEWLNPSGDSIFNDLQLTVDEPGVYTLFVFNDENGCSSSSAVEVLQDIETPVAVAGEDESITCDESAFTLDGSASSISSGVLTFQWTNSNNEIISNSETVEVDLADVYTLTVVAENGCSASDELEVLLNANVPIADAGTGGILNCEVPTITLGGNGSSSGNNIAYQWLNENNVVIATSSTTDIALPGTYTLIVTDISNNCSTSASIAIPQDIETPIADAGENATLTCLLTETTLDGSQSSSGQNLEYQWSNSNNMVISNEITALTNLPDTYTLIVVNTENSCSSVSTVIVDQNIETPVAVAGNDELITCNESTFTLDGSASSIGSGVLTFQWTNSDNEIISNSETATIDQADVYTLTVVAENGCSASDELEVTLDTNVPIADAGTGGTLDCEVSSVALGGNGTSTGNNISYQWLDENNLVIAITSTTDIALPGTYTLIVTDILNNCSTSASIAIPQDIETPVANAGNDAILNCQLTEITLDGAQSSSGTNFSYQWLNSNSLVISDEITVLTNQPDSYTLIVSNLENGCTAQSIVVIDQNIDTPTADAGADGVLTCDLSEISLDGSSSSGNNLSFEWFNGSGISVGNQAIIQVSQPGIYNLILTDTESACTAQSTVEVIPDDNLPTAIATVDDILTCEINEVTVDGSASTSVSGNISFEWLDGSGNSISTIENAAVLAPGVYTLIVTDTENGCSVSTTVEVEQNIETPIANAGENQILICGQTNLTLDAGGSTGQNLSFEWQDDNGIVIATTAVATAFSGGIYIVFVTDTENGCSASDSVEVIPDVNLPTADAGTAATLTCDVIQIMLDGSASSSGPNIEYEWQNSNGDIIATSQTTIITEPGTYTLFVLDTDNNCLSQDDVAVLEDIIPPTAFINTGSSTDLDCNNSSTVLDGTGSSPANQLEFSWTTDDGNILSGANTPNPEIDDEGTYTLTITSLINGCTASESIFINLDITPPVAIINTPQVLTCNLTEINLDATGSSGNGNFSYSWTSNPAGGIVSGGNTLQPVINQPGNYTIVVLNVDNGCESTAQMLVNENINPPTAAASVDDLFDCVTESVVLDGSGSSVGPAFIYNWTGNGSSIDNPTGLSPTVYEPGIYTILVTDLDNGCTQTADVLVEQDEDVPSAADIQVVEPVCYGDRASIAFVSVDGGDSPYLYSIDGGESFNPSGFFNSLSSGTYNIIIQDAKGCEYEDVVFIEAALELTLNLDREVILGLGDDYQINASTNIPTSEIDTIIWSPFFGLDCFDCLNPTVTEILNEIEYTLTVIDTNGCSVTAQIMLRVDKTREVFIPNAFSPNSDGNNDKIMIFANADKIKRVNTFRIFDRWGEIVFEANGFQPNDPDFGWDGIFNGEQLNPAVFVYFAEIEFIDDVTQMYKGDVTLMR